MTRMTTAALAVLALMLTATGTMAATGYATRDANLRAGAGTGYDIVGLLEKGEEVGILGCDDGWCATDEGYVAAAYVALAGYGDDEYDDEISGFDSEDGTFDDDPLDLEDMVPESIHD